MSYVTIKDRCPCGSRFSYIDTHGVNAAKEDKVDGIYFLAQLEYRRWQDVHKPCREAWAESLKPLTVGGKPIKVSLDGLT